MSGSPSSLFLAPVVASLLTLFAWWGLSTAAERRARRRHQRRALIYRCETCGHVYEDRRNVPLSTCRRCGTLNEAVKR